MNYSYTICIPLIPLAVFLFTGLAGSRFRPVVSGLIGCAGLFSSFVLSLITAWKYFFVGGISGNAYPTIIAAKTTWLHLTQFLSIDMGVMLDPISVMMLVVITTVSLMVHIYSMGYMKGERGFERFYAFLSLFSFSMLGLVLATNIFQMYIFWELVGVSSFLLIGFYYERPSAVAASKKAFIVTRFADLGFLIGILLLSFYTKTFDFTELTNPHSPVFTGIASVSFLGLSAITWAMLLIFMGGAGKSAMFPLHIWLPDAMEGPTPVSALIHAATMVVAGVYLVARMFPIYYAYSPNALTVISWVGGFTSLFAAVIACTQFDIKRVLAYSTLSQIGYMMLALGVSGFEGEYGLGYMASMFHLFTHAMFKALLFLGAGSVIHAVHSNLMNDMGGLRKHLPITHLTFLIACLAIAGIPPFAGFFSKDEILVAAWEHNKILFLVEYTVAGLTAFYMFRLYFGIFWNKAPHYHHEPHESPLTMTLPLIFLAVGSAFTGFIPFGRFVSADHIPFETQMHLNIAIPSVLIALTGIFVAFLFYRKENSMADRIARSFGAVYKTVYHKFYIDELYLFVTKKILFNLVSRLIAWFDRHIVDGAMNGIACVVSTTSEKIKGMQSGQIQHYALAFISGAIILVLIVLYQLS
jgi:NADH-quinone oxidoreductase subunit L